MRSEPFVVIVAGITLSVFAWLICIQNSPLESSSASNEPHLSQPATDVEREFAKTDLADKLFDQQKWSKARSVYDEVIAAQSDWYSPVARRAVERAILCSLKLRDGDDALRRAMSFHSRLKPRIDWRARELDPPWELDPVQEFAAAHAQELTARRADITHLEFVHRLFDEIAHQTRTAGDARLRSRLTTARIALDFQLIERLDPSSFFGNEDANMNWWWEGVPEAEAYFEESSSQIWWYGQTGIPLDFDGKLLVMTAPTKYQAARGGGEKVLFLLNEIERLDPSTSKDDAARTLLYRADLARRLYGPNGDPSWRHAQLNNSLLSLSPRRSSRNLKAFWDLEDDEARTMVGQRTKVITLPDSESPLALLRLLEAKYPNSQIVPEAIYQRGSYYQCRGQFAKAADEYGRLIARFPKHGRAQSAKEQLEDIEHADVLLAKTGVYPLGSKPKLWFACRNTEQVEFTAQPFDLEKYVKDQVKDGNWWGAETLVEDVFDDESENDFQKRFLGQKVTKWSQPVPNSDQATSHSTLALLTEPGAYIVEARVQGTREPARGLVVITSVAIVQKPLSDKLLLWVVDSRTGRPLANRTVQILNRGTTLTTNEDGLIAYSPKEMAEDSAFALVVGEDHSIAYCELADLGYSKFARIQHEYCSVTDRPVYRPGSTVHFRIWTRKLADRKFRPAESGLKLRLTVTVVPGTAAGGRMPASRSGGGFFSVFDAGENIIKTLELETDRFASVSGSFKLGNETPLGEYRLILQNGYAGAFRVEEYKNPGFEVTVKPAKKQARFGEFVKAKVNARDSFGVPVSQAQVRYRILRRRYRVRYAIPREFDWLYGRAYGNYKSSSPQPVDSPESVTENWGSAYEDWFDFQSVGEVVGEGTVRLKNDGTAEISIDTSAVRDVGDFDQQYIIHVEVRDASRRTVEGVGTVLVTRQQFSAFVELNRGWYQSGGEVLVDVSTRTANNFPVSAEGKLSLHRVTLGGANSTDAVQQADQTWNVKTGGDGHFAFKFSVPTAGRYRLMFAAQDARNQTVTGTVSFWVSDRNLNGKQFPFQELEIIPDRRSYKVGETARLLINTAQPNARLLLCDSHDQYRFIDIPDHSHIVEVRIEDRHVPNHFVEVTLIRNGHTYVRSCELFVPPVKDLLKVELQPDKDTFRPGEKRHVRVKVSDADGNPVSGEVTLTAYDKSLTSIQDDYFWGPISLISRRKMDYWSDGVFSTVGRRKFETTGDFLCPEFSLVDDGWAHSIFGAGESGGTSDFFETTLSLVLGRGQRVRQSRIIDESAEDRREEYSDDDIFADLVQPAMRTQFVDTSIWLPHLVLDERGIAEAEIVFPESLTTWQMRAYVVTKGTQVGEATAEVTASKNLLVRR